MSCLRALVAAGSVALAASTSLAQQVRITPVDEAIRDPEFFLFRARLQSAIAAHDTTELMRVVSPHILNSLGGDGGPDEFRRYWRLHQPEENTVWVTLGFVLALGGRFMGDTMFYAPYTMGPRYPGDGFDALAVLGRNVMVRAKPTTSSPPVDMVSFEAVTMWREKSATGEWEPVRTLRGRTGWVLKRYLRSPITYRAGFVRRNGRWWMTALLAGD